jgi:peptide deformylase
MVRPIVIMGDPVLRTKAADVTVFDDELRGLVDDMFETMYHAEGVGLAANQVGVLQRVLVVDVRDEKTPEAGRMALINPRVVESTSNTDKEAEGCLSIPGIEEVVERPWGVWVEAQDVRGKKVRVPADALLARALQHEIDHLDGVLFLDRVSPLKRKLLMKKWRKSQAEKEKEQAEGK